MNKEPQLGDQQSNHNQKQQKRWWQWMRIDDKETNKAIMPKKGN
jgi:hypothetical protein